MIIFQLILFCCVFTLEVRLSVLGGAVNGLYFYPKEYQRIAFERGIADPAEIAKRSRRFRAPFLATMFVVLMLIVGVWNRTSDFGSAYWQSLLFLEVMNWYDGIIIDRLWVGHSRFWVIPGMEDQPFVQSWRQVFIKRGILTVIWIIAAAIPAGILSLLYRI